MPTIQIADKPTLDSVKTTVEGTSTDVITLKARGGIKYNATSSKPQVYDVANAEWVDLNVAAGGASPTLVVRNKAHSMDNVDITVYDKYFTSIKNMGTNTYISFELPYLGDFTVTYVDVGGVTKTQTITIDNVGGVTLDAVNFPSFATATDAQITNMLDLHYQDEIDLSTIWAVGDTRTVSLSAMEATGVGESHVAQDIKVAIAGFDIDTLTTSINGHTKAAITLTQVDCLKEIGYMNSSSSSSWSGSERRTWCNSVYYNALPSTFKSIIKRVNKITAKTPGGSTNQTTAEYCWLLAEREILASRIYSNQTEFNALSTYPYYNNGSNRVKKVNGSANHWWERSPYYNGYGFCVINSGGSAAYDTSYNQQGLAPCMCL